MFAIISEIPAYKKLLAGDKMSKYIFTSESVTEGHPDKICDAVSDAVLDEYLSQDIYSRVACETLQQLDWLLFRRGASKGNVDIESVVKDTFSTIGYNEENSGVGIKQLEVISKLDKQVSRLLRVLIR